MSSRRCYPFLPSFRNRSLNETLVISRLEILMRWRAAPCDATQGNAQVTESTPFLWSTGHRQVEVNKKAHLVRAALYAVQTFYAFMIMWVLPGFCASTLR